ncbi:hypothetical protein SAMN05720766_101126 [Fibrobacter sp. UWH9]|uniref:hypothetical protein n=1 Tax=Fibrobacter sp. UWH9 TaxID=1896213 RepID=UPI0009131C2F|nr:hypothetical protein [Fibrobacter sp. UWH9]SHG29756.1 hypothetical protein SAMN05720766_101126 [Fibrobacter sp. UWH9]
MMNKFAFVSVVSLSMALTVGAFAEDIIAKTSNGSTVILHDNGRWEYYQNNAQIRDVRPTAIPEDVKYQISVDYESVDKLKKDVRMAMEADFATEEEIKDSLRKVPKGGIVYFQVPKEQIKKGMVRDLTFYIYDKGKNPIFTQSASDDAATPSESSKIMNLMVAPLYAHPKANVLKAKAVCGRETIEFEIPVK